MGGDAVGLGVGLVEVALGQVHAVELVEGCHGAVFCGVGVGLDEAAAEGEEGAPVFFGGGGGGAEEVGGWGEEEFVGRVGGCFGGEGVVGVIGEG